MYVGIEEIDEEDIDEDIDEDIGNGIGKGTSGGEGEDKGVGNFIGDVEVTGNNGKTIWARSGSIIGCEERGFRFSKIDSYGSVVI